jgi:hypothetical protein
MERLELKERVQMSKTPTKDFSLVFPVVSGKTGTKTLSVLIVCIVTSNDAVPVVSEATLSNQGFGTDLIMMETARASSADYPNNRTLAVFSPHVEVV